jgi:LDH2 family malate/lactate/ureidoglycolate dehydrogenase
VLLLSDLYGIESHGMQRMYRYYKSIQKGMIHPENKGGICHGFMAIDPAIFGDAEDIKAHLSHYLETLRNSPKADGQDKIYTHGEKEIAAKAHMLANGVPVNDNTMVEVYEMCQYLNMDFGKYFGDYVPERSEGFKSPETFK